MTKHPPVMWVCPSPTPLQCPQGEHELSAGRWPWSQSGFKVLSALQSCFCRSCRARRNAAVSLWCN